MYQVTHISILWPRGLCPGLPGWATTRTNLDFTEARDGEWQWHQPDHMQICSSPQLTTPTPHHSVFNRLDSWCQTNSIKALKAQQSKHNKLKIVPTGDWGHLLTLNLTSDDLESHIVMNVSSISDIIPSFIKIGRSRFFWQTLKSRDSITSRKFKNPERL